MRAYAWTPTLRLAAVALQALACANLLELALRDLFDMIAPAGFERAPLPLVAFRLFFFSVLPALIFLVLREVARAALELEEGELVLTARGERIAIPRASIAELRPWRLPLPAPGVALILRSGRTLGYALSGAGAEALGIDDVTFRDAAARRRLRWLHLPVIKYGVVPAALTFILFRLHELITAGGLLGEWQLYGFSRWAHTLLGVALYSFGHLAIHGGAVRAIVESIAQPAARLLSPPAARRARLWLEALAALAYYGALIAALILKLAV